MRRDTVIDFSAGLPDPGAIRDAGHEGAVLYCSPARETWMKGKQPDRDYLDKFDHSGLKYAWVWQYGGADNPDVMRGTEGGKADATAAKEYLMEVRAAGHPVFFAVDFDITLDQWNRTAVEYFRACCEVLGRDRVGIYGHSRAVSWAQQDGVVAEVGPGRVLGWVTSSWSDDKASEYAVLYQGTHNVPGPAGVQVDVNDIYHSEWGWRAIGGVTPPPPEVMTLAPTRTQIQPQPDWRGDPIWLPVVLEAWGVKVRTLPGWDQWGMGDFDDIRGVVCHHTAGANTSAQYIARNPGLSGGLSSQLHLDRAGIYTLCGVGIAWHAGLGEYPPELTGYVKRKTSHGMESFTTANACTIGFEAVNAGDGSQPWPPEQMRAYKLGVAAVLWFKGFDASHAWGHKEVAPSRKIDPNFDMDAFRRDVQALLDNPPLEVQMIGVFMALNEGEQRELLDLARDIRTQLRGPGNEGWKQLGQNAAGQNLTLVDGVAALRHDIASLATLKKEEK